MRMVCVVYIAIGCSNGERVIWDGSVKKGLYHILWRDWCNRRYSDHELYTIVGPFPLMGLPSCSWCAPTTSVPIWILLFSMYFINRLRILDEIIIGSEQACRLNYRFVYNMVAYWNIFIHYSQWSCLCD